MKLGVNIDHVATLRQARRGNEPDVLSTVEICEKAGADSIVAHLREDRRHMQDVDIIKLRKIVKTRFNLELSIHPEIVAIAMKVKPDQITLVPERREEITTEGGLDVKKFSKRIRQIFDDASKAKIVTSLFIAPDKNQIDATYGMGVKMVEFHTGCYANAKTKIERNCQLKQLRDMTDYAGSLGIVVNVGHGLNYENIDAVAKIQGVEELNIGHSIISRAVFVGLENAVKEMKKLIT